MDGRYAGSVVSFDNEKIDVATETEITARSAAEQDDLVRIYRRN